MTVMEQFDLTGKVAIVTGGNGGIGQALAHALTEAGARIVIAARDLASSQTVAQTLSEKGAGAIAVKTDITQPDSVEWLCCINSLEG